MKNDDTNEMEGLAPSWVHILSVKMRRDVWGSCVQLSIDCYSPKGSSCKNPLDDKCNALEWFEAVDDIDELYRGPDKLVISNGMPVEVYFDCEIESWFWKVKGT